MKLSLKQLIEGTLRPLPYFRQLFFEIDQLRSYSKFVPLGHFYSPIPSLDEIRRNDAISLEEQFDELPAIDLNAAHQLTTLMKFKRYSPDVSFEATANARQRYFYENGYFSYLDAMVLYCMMREVRPKRIIEIGSGFSSCVILDTNELHFDQSIACTFIEPYPERLYSLIREADRRSLRIFETPVQDIELQLFTELEAGDILFVDSSHVSKLNSDVNHIIFRILPALRSGVYIHFHDVFYPFEYPKEWIHAGAAWNEAYLLRAFLQYNTAFSVEFFNSFMKRFFKHELLDAMLLTAKEPEPEIEVKNAPAGSLWFRKNGLIGQP